MRAPRGGPPVVTVSLRSATWKRPSRRLFNGPDARWVPAHAPPQATPRRRISLSLPQLSFPVHGCTLLQEMGIAEALWRHRTCTEVRLLTAGCSFVVGKAAAYRMGIAPVGEQALSCAGWTHTTALSAAAARAGHPMRTVHPVNSSYPQH